MSDLIKREDAIKWFEPYANRGLKIPVETVIQNLKDIPSAEEWKDECDRAYATGWIRGMESVDCNICEQRGRCDRGRAVDCPINKPKTEPQTETSTIEGKVQLTDCAWRKEE